MNDIPWGYPKLSNEACPICFFLQVRGHSQVLIHLRGDAVRFHVFWGEVLVLIKYDKLSSLLFISESYDLHKCETIALLMLVSIKHALFLVLPFSFLCRLGNKNLLKHHPTWQSLLEFYEEKHCLVNESDWPTN